MPTHAVHTFDGVVLDASLSGCRIGAGAVPPPIKKQAVSGQLMVEASFEGGVVSGDVRWWDEVAIGCSFGVHYAAKAEQNASLVHLVRRQASPKSPIWPWAAALGAVIALCAWLVLSDQKASARTAPTPSQNQGP